MIIFSLPVTGRAAQFCTFCNPSIRNFIGNLYNKELQLSRFDVIKAWTKVWISDVDINTLLFLLFFIKGKNSSCMQILHGNVTMHVYAYTVRGLVESYTLVVRNLELNTVGINDFVHWLLYSNSVLSPFNFNLVLTIHRSISFAHISIYLFIYKIRQT